MQKENLLPLAIQAQKFVSFNEWCNKASSWIGPDNREFYSIPKSAQVICFDSKGKVCRRGVDFKRAKEENAFPVYWLWDFQIAEIIIHGRIIEQ